LRHDNALPVEDYLDVDLEPPLVVDLDGTLIKVDLLFETTSRFLTLHPLLGLQLVRWPASGKTALKTRLSEDVEVDAASLPYNERLLAWLREARAAGRRLVLATASHRRFAEAVAAHLGLFDEVFATDGNTNLKSGHKRDLLVSRYGERNFDYVGNSSSDLVVWQAARCAYVVSTSASLIAKARTTANVEQVFTDEKPPLVKSLFRALRPQQCLKNLLVFVPLLAAQRYADKASVIEALLAFVVFGLTASSVYLLNDLVDVADDRRHARKRYRPFAAGDLSMLNGWVTWPTLLVGAFTLAVLTLPGQFVAALFTYFALTLAYSLMLKRRAVIDVLTLAGLYTLRIIAGAAAISVPLSFWLLTASIFIFLSLAFVKRFSEIKIARDNNETGLLHGRGWLPGDLELASTLGSCAGYLSVLVLALYIQDSHTADLYKTPKLIWLACPLLLFWISRVWLVAHRGKMHDDPVIFALKDRASWLTGICLIGTFLVAKATH
jgi:4-hydroxybenzoate polyprenyltransferase/phosphoserine phosphatase